MSRDLGRMGPFLWHGAFLALTMAMIEPNTVLPALLGEFTDSPALLGAAYSILLGAPVVFNLWFSRLQRGFPRKKPFLLVGIYARTLSFVGLAAVTLLSPGGTSGLTLGLVLGLILIFSLSGGFAGIAYTELIGKTIEGPDRPRLYAARQLVGGLAALAGAGVVALLFAPGSLPFPANYSTALLIGAGGLFIGAFGFWAVKEPPTVPPADPAPRALFREVQEVLGKDRAFLRFLVLENITSLSLMVLPFYMVFAQESFPGASDHLGLYVLAQTLGALLSNLAWAWAARQWGTGSVIRLCIGLGALLPVAALVLGTTGPTLYALVFFLVGFVISGRNIGFEPTLLEIAPPAQRTLYLGIRGTLNVLMVLLPLTGGLIVQLLGFPPTFGLVSLGMTGAFILTVLPESHRGSD